MKAPKEILDVWKLQKEHGDIESIHETYAINRKTVTDALRTGNMSSDTFLAIKTFYTKKRKAEKELIKETLK